MWPWLLIRHKLTGKKAKYKVPDDLALYSSASSSVHRILHAKMGIFLMTPNNESFDWFNRIISIIYMISQQLIIQCDVCSVIFVWFSYFFLFFLFKSYFFKTVLWNNYAFVLILPSGKKKFWFFFQHLQVCNLIICNNANEVPMMQTEGLKIGAPLKLNQLWIRISTNCVQVCFCSSRSGSTWIKRTNTTFSDRSNWKFVNSYILNHDAKSYQISRIMVT